MPVPSPIASLAPASQPLTLPYPAYGTPVPGVNRGVPSTVVPQVVSLDQAIAIGFARSPLLAQARATVEIDTAPVDLARTAVLPSLSGVVSTAGTIARKARASTSTGSGTISGSGGATGDVTANNVSASLKQLIYDGGKVAAQLRAAKATAKRGHRDVQARIANRRL